MYMMPQTTDQPEFVIPVPQINIGPSAVLGTITAVATAVTALCEVAQTPAGQQIITRMIENDAAFRAAIGKAADWFKGLLNK